jgi:ABC-type Fe3+-hydroxamate transport system substrate-binding protein
MKSVCRLFGLRVCIPASLLLAGLVLATMLNAGEGAQGYPKRIVSLAPTITEQIYLLGAQDRLIANTVYCVVPPEAKQKEKVGTVIQANIEKIISLKPDLVLVSSLARPRQLRKLENLGILVVRFDYPKSFSEICQHFLRLGEIIGEGDKANKIIADAKREIKEIREKTGRLPKKKVFIQIGIKPLFTVTKDSFLNDYIEFCGGSNIALDEKSGVYSREKVLEWNPDVIIITTMGIAGEKEKESWEKYRSMAAVRNNNIHIVDPDKVCSPTPITFVEALKEIAEIIHPGIQFTR